MIRLTIMRQCGHHENIGVAGFCGNVEDVSVKYREEVEKNIQWQRDKLCLKCFNKLPDEEKRRLTREAIENGNIDVQG